MRAFKEVAYEAARRPLVFSEFMLATMEPTKLPLSWKCNHSGVSNVVTYTQCGTLMGVIVRLTCAHCKRLFSDVAIERNGMRGMGTAYGRFLCPHGHVHQMDAFEATLLLDVGSCDRCRDQLTHAQLG